MRPVMFLLAATFACSGGAQEATPADAPPTGEEGGAEAAPPEAKEPEGPTRIENGKERAAYATKEGELAATFTFGGKSVRMTAPVEQISMRLGDVPSLEYPIGHVKLDATQVGIEAHPDWVEPFEKTVLTSYGTPIQIFFDVASVTDMVGSLDGPGSEAAGIVLGGIQANDTKLETTIPAAFTRTEAGLDIDIQRFEVRAADLRLAEPLATFASKVGAGKPGDTFAISGQLSLPYFTGATLPTFVRVPVTISRARDIEIMVDESVGELDAAKRRLQAHGFDAAWFKKRNLDDETLERNRKYAEKSRGRYRELDLEAKQRQAGRAADGTQER